MDIYYFSFLMLFKFYLKGFTKKKKFLVCKAGSVRQLFSFISHNIK